MTTIIEGRKLWLFLLLSIGMLSIGCNSDAPGKQFDTKGYETESIGDGAESIKYRDNNGFLLAQGTLINGVRNGAWVTFHENSNKVKKITNYIHGEKSGVEIEMNDRGQIETLTTYKNNTLNGLKADYKFGRVIEEVTYKDGVLHGPFSIYTTKSVLQKKGSFKNGKQHGLLQFFDEKGNVTLQYTYENGKKISGGIVNPKENQ